jgi:hypothetical protein
MGTATSQGAPIGGRAVIDGTEESPMKASTGITAAAAVASMIGLAAVSAHAAPLILNGGFESGFAFWSTADQAGGDGTFFVQSGASSPVNLDPVPAPPEGANAAMTDSSGPGSHVLFQDFVATAGAATLSFDLFVGNRATDAFGSAFGFAIPPGGSLDFALTSQSGSQTLNQQARIDILKGGADPFSVAAADVLLKLFQTALGDASVSGYTSYTVDLSALFAAHAGQTLRLRFAETDNVGPFQFGVDDVRIDVVPEPASLPLFGAGLLALLASSGGVRPGRSRLGPFVPRRT